ncbi:MAG TPA: chemotaxis-specific protein-glutamate methyltransferase CheB, partial [Solirubrobacteraceae bacterium]
DDSPFMRTVLGGALGAAGFDVVGTARDGDEALAQCRATRPDAMTLDLAMPGLDGLGVLRALKENGAPDVPVIVVSAFSPAHGARAVDALAEGAFDLVPKPAVGEPFHTFTENLAERLRQAVAQASTAPLVGNGGAANGHAAPAPRAAAPATGAPRAVVIAASTGGPRALAQLLPALPARLGEGTLIVQHMPAGFTGSLAARLDRMSPMHVREAALGDQLEPGTALIAPGGAHLRLDGARQARLTDEAPVGGLRPRADLTIADVAAGWGERTLLVVLTGMGRDGAQGARAVRAAGGRILCEAAESCTVYGMPRAVIEDGLADVVLPLGELAEAIAAEAGA